MQAKLLQMEAEAAKLNEEDDNDEQIEDTKDQLEDETAGEDTVSYFWFCAFLDTSH